MSNPVPPILAGIAIGAVSTAIWADRENAWRRWSDWAEARIRELEAELAECGRSRHALLAGSEAAESLYEQMKARVAELEAKLAYELVHVSGLTESEARRVMTREREAER